MIDGGVDIILQAVNASNGNVLVFLPDRAYIRNTEHTLRVCFAVFLCSHWCSHWV